MWDIFQNKFVIPQKYKVTEISEKNGRRILQTGEKVLQKPLKNQLIVKMQYSVINPADLVFIRGSYGIESSIGSVPGLEGSGIVVGAGPGMAGKLLIGRRVASTPLPGGDGTFGEYMITGVNNVVPLLPSVSLNAGATLVVNPLTANALFDIVRGVTSDSVMISVPTGALGSMLMKLGKKLGFSLVVFLRKEKYLPQIMSYAPQAVIKGWEPDYAAQMKEITHRYNTKIALDGAGGNTLETLAHNMPRGSKIVVYGSLSGNKLSLLSSDFIFNDIQIEGFWLHNWISKGNKLNLAKKLFSVQKNIHQEYQTNIIKTISLENINDGINYYKEYRSNGKVLIKF